MSCGQRARARVTVRPGVTRWRVAAVLTARRRGVARVEEVLEEGSVSELTRAAGSAVIPGLSRRRTERGKEGM